MSSRGNHFPPVYSILWWTRSSTTGYSNRTGIFVIYFARLRGATHTKRYPRSEIMIGPNARENNYGAKQLHDVSRYESIPMGTPNVTTVPTATNQVIPASAIYCSGTTSSGRMTLKKMPGAPKNDTTEYVFYCDEKRFSVAQMYPDRSKSNISKMMSAQWKKLPAAENRPFAYKHISYKLRYQLNLEAFKVVVGAEKVSGLEEADKSEHEGKKRNKAIERLIGMPQIDSEYLS